MKSHRKARGDKPARKMKEVVCPTDTPLVEGRSMTFLRSRLVDGLWNPPREGEHSISGILVESLEVPGSIPTRMLVLELTESCPYVVNIRLPGEKGLVVTAGAGCRVAVTEWQKLEGLWPTQEGHKVEITRGEKKLLGRGRLMFDVGVRASVAKLRGSAPTSPPLRVPTTVLPSDAYKAALRADAEARAHIKKPESMAQGIFDGVMSARSHALKEIGAIDEFLLNWPKGSG